MDKAAIVGAGLIGRAWAVVFARGGWDVRLTDPSAEALEAAPRLIRAALDDLAAAGLVRDPAGAAALISVAGSVAEALDGADLVQENGPERVDEKRRIFAELDAAAPRAAILASSTSAIVASQFTEDLPGRERCLVAHPVAEACLRVVGARFGALTFLEVRSFSEIEVAAPLRLVSIHGHGLAQIGATGAVTSGPHVIAQQWSRAVHDHQRRRMAPLSLQSRQWRAVRRSLRACRGSAGSDSPQPMIIDRVRLADLLARYHVGIG